MYLHFLLARLYEMIFILWNMSYYTSLNDLNENYEYPHTMFRPVFNIQQYGLHCVHRVYRLPLG